jgi:tetratricopeptide (TPR) repeat protein
MEPLKDKILALLIQLPPSYQLKEGLEDFRNYEAIKNYSDLLGYYYSLADEQGIAYALVNVGIIHDRKGEYDKAIKTYEDSLEILRKLGDQQINKE